MRPWIRSGWPLAVCLLLGCTSLAVSAKTSPTAQAAGAVQGYVHSSNHLESFQPGRSYHLMLLASESLLSDSELVDIERRLAAQLHRAGYGAVSENLLKADVVVVARLGVRADRPSIDDILTQGADPNALLATGVRYLQLEAYDMPDYLAFLRSHENAAEDVNLQFQAWRTTVESRGLLADYVAVLPSLLQVLSVRMGTHMPAVEQFSVASR